MAGAEAERRHVTWRFQIDYFNSHSLFAGADVMHNPEVWTFWQWLPLLPLRSQRGVRIIKQNRSLEAWRKIVSPTNSPVPKRVPFLGDCTSISEVSCCWANCIPHNSLTPHFSAIWAYAFHIHVPSIDVRTLARVDDNNTQQAAFPLNTKE